MSILSLQVSCFADLDVNFHQKKLRAQVQLKVEGALKKALRNYWLHVAEILRLIFTKNHKSILNKESSILFSTSHPFNLWYKNWYVFSNTENIPTFSTRVFLKYLLCLCNGKFG